ncbi:hypothetical protein QQM79_05330 [Marinobacteraceae bacterium S3BR75-40.1]
MNVVSASQAALYMQTAASQAQRPSQAPTATPKASPQPAGNAEETGESRAVQAAEGEVGGRINTYA